MPVEVVTVPAAAPGQTLEIVKIVAQLAMPVTAIVIALWVNRALEKFKHLQWRNQKLIEKRLEAYEKIAPDLNDLLCYFTYVGTWRDVSPETIVSMKRALDKKIHLAAPLFSGDFIKTCDAFVNLCYQTFNGMGADALLRSTIETRKPYCKTPWNADWDACFTGEQIDKARYRATYGAVMKFFSHEIGLGGQPEESAPAKLPPPSRTEPLF